MPNKKRILVAPLNWGLGHSSRCIPLIKVLKNLGHEVILASDGAALKLLQKNFPSEEVLELPELNVKYGTKSGAAISILRQLPQLNRYIRKEKQAIDQYVANHSLDLIISDNRYGVYHSGIPSVIIAHQLKIKFPLAERISSQLIGARLKYFDECWVPDDASRSLSGELSSSSLPIEKYSIGLLSQFIGRKESSSKQAKEDELLVILSGPEPARSQFEECIIEQVENNSIKTLIIRGKDETKEDLEYVRFKGFLAAEDLLKELCKHDKILCRSGYSTIMDLCYLNQEALLVPSPGQLEQEYLASYHAGRGNFYSVKEKRMNLSKDLDQAFGNGFQPPVLDTKLGQLEQLISKRIEDLTQ